VGKPLKVFVPIVSLLLILNFFPLSHASDLQTINRVIDGDTLLLDNCERVRLIGVDCPEVHTSNKLRKDAERSQQDIETIRMLGQKSSAFVKKLVAGKRVRLEYDQANAAIGHRDRYGRILAYVYLEDETFLNEEIVKKGYGVAYTKYPFKYMDEFRTYEREAREKRRGLWGE
jgi:micrococcal nuclease